MYEKTKNQEVPKRGRKSASLFEATTEWDSLKADLDRGLKKKEQGRLAFSPEDWERMGLSGEPEKGRNTAVGCKSVRRCLQKYMSTIGREYPIKTFHSGGLDFIIVAGPESVQLSSKQGKLSSP